MSHLELAGSRCAGDCVGAPCSHSGSDSDACLVLVQDLMCIDAGTRRIMDFEPDMIIAIGGGSPMDAAKVNTVSRDTVVCTP